MQSAVCKRQLERTLLAHCSPRSNVASAAHCFERVRVSLTLTRSLSPLSASPSAGAADDVRGGAAVRGVLGADQAVPGGARGGAVAVRDVLGGALLRLRRRLLLLPLARHGQQLRQPHRLQLHVAQLPGSLLPIPSQNHNSY